MNRVSCKFKAQDSELICANCSFAAFKQRQKITNKNDEQQQSSVQQQDRPAS